MTSFIHGMMMKVLLSSGGGIGRRARLRTWWGNPWGFESPPEHHLQKLLFANLFWFCQKFYGLCEDPPCSHP